MPKFLFKILLFLILFSVFGCSTKPNYTQFLNWDKNTPLIKPKLQTSFEPIFNYNPLTNDLIVFNLIFTNKNYFVPAYIDRRGELLPTSNQGEFPYCAAYAMAGWIEYNRWKNEGITEQIDPRPIYLRCKEIDNSKMPGTTFDAALQAVQDLKLISPIEVNNINYIYSLAEVKRAIHKYGVVLAAFKITDNWSFADSNGWIHPGGKPTVKHAVLLCGYNDLDMIPYVIFQNSSGKRQGWQGFNRISQELFKEQFDYGMVWDNK